ADESPNLWVVVARIVVVEPKLLIVLLRRKLVRYCVKARRIAGRNLAKREMNDSCLLAVAGRCCVGNESARSDVVRVIEIFPHRWTIRRATGQGTGRAHA